MSPGVPAAGLIDVIGDIHGEYAALASLLDTLGYEHGSGRWTHAQGCRIVFVGDYIDRGPDPVRVTKLVRQLCDDGVAFALLGNHDVNAIQFSMRADHRGVLDPLDAHRCATGVLDGNAAPARGWLRTHEGKDRVPKNISQHARTLRNTTPEQYESIVKWSCGLPAWLELPGLRVVHAAWIAPAMHALDAWATRSGLPSLGIRAETIEQAIQMQRDRLHVLEKQLSPLHWHDLLDLRGRRAERSRPDSCIAVALERVLKGVEAELPKGVSYRDLDGFERRSVRVRWFEPAGGRTFAEHAMVRREVRAAIGDGTLGACIGDEYSGILPMTSGDAYAPEARPVIFGHYGLRRTDVFDRWPSNVACVDTSVFDNDGGALAVYRWAGEHELVPSRLFVAQNVHGNR